MCVYVVLCYNAQQKSVNNAYIFVHTIVVAGMWKMCVDFSAFKYFLMQFRVSTRNFLNFCEPNIAIHTHAVHFLPICLSNYVVHSAAEHLCWHPNKFLPNQATSFTVFTSHELSGNRATKSSHVNSNGSANWPPTCRNVFMLCSKAFECRLQMLLGKSCIRFVEWKITFKILCSADTAICWSFLDDMQKFQCNVCLPNTIACTYVCIYICTGQPIRLHARWNDAAKCQWLAKLKWNLVMHACVHVYVISESIILV